MQVKVKQTSVTRAVQCGLGFGRVCPTHRGLLIVTGWESEIFIVDCYNIRVRWQELLLVKSRLWKGFTSLMAVMDAKVGNGSWLMKYCLSFAVGVLYKKLVNCLLFFMTLWGSNCFRCSIWNISSMHIFLLFSCSLNSFAKIHFEQELMTFIEI